jgi:hypothetical protein
MGYRQLNARLAKLEGQLPKLALAQDHQASKRRGPVARRLARLFEGAGRLMTEEESGKMDQALRQWIEGQHGPYDMWFGELLRGRGRLPALDPAAMKGLPPASSLHSSMQEEIARVSPLTALAAKSCRWMPWPGGQPPVMTPQAAGSPEPTPVVTGQVTCTI